MKLLKHRERKARQELKPFTCIRSGFRLALCAVFVFAISSAVASGSTTKLAVTATVLKHASLQVLSQPNSISVTAADIARGYVDVPAPAQLAVRSNSPLGYMLEFSSNGYFFREILVNGLSVPVQLSPAGGAVLQPAAASGVTRATMDLGFRFLLHEAAQPGVYPWPIHVSVSPV